MGAASGPAAAAKASGARWGFWQKVKRRDVQLPCHWEVLRLRLQQLEPLLDASSGQAHWLLDERHPAPAQDEGEGAEGGEAPAAAGVPGAAGATVPGGGGVGELDLAAARPLLRHVFEGHPEAAEELGQQLGGAAAAAAAAAAPGLSVAWLLATAGAGPGAAGGAGGSGCAGGGAQPCGGSDPVYEAVARGGQPPLVLAEVLALAVKRRAGGLRVKLGRGEGAGGAGGRQEVREAALFLLHRQQQHQQQGGEQQQGEQQGAQQGEQQQGEQGARAKKRRRKAQQQQQEEEGEGEGQGQQQQGPAPPQQLQQAAERLVQAVQAVRRQQEQGACGGAAAPAFQASSVNVRLLQRVVEAPAQQGAPLGGGQRRARLQQEHGQLLALASLVVSCSGARAPPPLPCSTHAPSLRMHCAAAAAQHRMPQEGMRLTPSALQTPRPPPSPAPPSLPPPPQVGRAELPDLAAEHIEVAARGGEYPPPPPGREGGAGRLASAYAREGYRQVLLEWAPAGLGEGQASRAAAADGGGEAAAAPEQGERRQQRRRVVRFEDAAEEEQEEEAAPPEQQQAPQQGADRAARVGKRR
jgi:hypothetical protein